MGIGEKLSITLAQAGANIILFSRTEDKLRATVDAVKDASPKAQVNYYLVDIQDYDSVKSAVDKAVKERGPIDVLINNAGLALGAPSRFNDLKIQDIMTMNQTNVNGTMFMTYAVLNASMIPRGSGTILNVSSTTALEAPPFPGEAVYHANKACLEGFTNALRNELVGTDIRVLALRPGVVDTNFHEQRVGYDKKLHDDFFDGFE
jgi:3-hydroxy acid dehydrogenase/malonic semialdehyde reductase